MEQTGSTPIRDIYRENLSRVFRTYLAPIIGQAAPNVLSVGCYFGYEAEPILRVFPGASYKGIDIDDVAIMGGMDMNADLGARANFEVADARDQVSFGTTPWDIIILRNPQLQRTSEDWGTIIGNSTQALRTNGIIFISTEEEEERQAMVSLISSQAGMNIITNTRSNFPISEGAFRDMFVIIARKDI